MDATYIRSSSAEAPPSYQRHFIRGALDWAVSYVPSKHVSAKLLSNLVNLDVNEADQWHDHVVTCIDNVRPSYAGSRIFAVGTYENGTQSANVAKPGTLKNGETVITGRIRLDAVVSFAKLPDTMLKHVLCKHWLYKGECLFGHECVYLHVMPDNDTLARMQYRKRPLWWRKYQDFTMPKHKSERPARRPARIQGEAKPRRACKKTDTKHRQHRRQDKTQRKQKLPPAAQATQVASEEDLIDLEADLPMVDREAGLDEYEVDYSNKRMIEDYPCLQVKTAYTTL